jgi:hypothetical protein
MGWLDKLLGREKRTGAETPAPPRPQESRPQEGAGIGGEGGAQQGSMGPEGGAGPDRPEEDRI